MMIQKQHINFEFDEELCKKENSTGQIDAICMDTFEFYHQKTDKYLMGERIENGFKIYSNFMITEFEIIARWRRDYHIIRRWTLKWM